MTLKPNSNVKATESTTLLSPIADVSHISFESSNHIGSLIANSRSYNADLERARVLLYISHFFAQFSEVSWQFGLVLFLSAICYHKSLLLVSTYGLVSSLSGFAFGGMTGRFVDASPRLRVTRFFIWTENGSVVLATACCYFLLSYNTYDVKNEHIILDTAVVFLLLGLHLFGSLAAVLDRGFRVAIERDWVVVMSQMVGKALYASEEFSSDSISEESKELVIEKDENRTLCPSAREREWLSHTNVTMRQIDLTCKVVAPSFTGFLAGDSSTDLRVACVAIGLLNMLALVLEYECTKSIYSLVPDLSNKKREINNEKASNGGKCSDAQNFQDSETFIQTQEGNELFSTYPQQQRTQANSTSFRWYCNRVFIPSAWRLYFSQRVAPAGIALSLLYLNILSFGALMTSYLVSRNMQLGVVGFWRGISSAIGLLGTLAYRKSVSTISLETTGQWSIMAQFVCLLTCYASLFMHNNNASLAMLIGGTCCSRVGLWVFDLSVTQLMQQYTPVDIRGSIGGVQESFQAMFTLITFVLGICFPNPRDFHYFIELGCCSVGIAMICFTTGIFINQNQRVV